jgi:hypothetical protein
MLSFFVLLRARGHIDLPPFWENFTIIIKMHGNARSAATAMERS